MSADGELIPKFLDTKVVSVPDGQCFSVIGPYTNYRSCHDGHPFEARIVFLCQSTAPTKPNTTTTAAELEALQKFRDAKTACAPHLVAFEATQQGPGVPSPEGYITYAVMTKMPGVSLLGKYLNMTSSERGEIVPTTVTALKAIHALGIEPIDRGMRNVISDTATTHCSIIDFELWNLVADVFEDDKAEMQR